MTTYFVKKQSKENSGALLTDIDNDLCVWTKICRCGSLTSEIYASKEKDSSIKLPIEIGVIEQAKWWSFGFK